MKKLITIILIFVYSSIVSQTSITPLNLWKTNGNSISTNTNFIGTTSNRSLLFKTNNTQRLKIDSTGGFIFNKSASSTEYNAIFTDGIIKGAMYTFTPAVFTGFWFGTANRYPLLLGADFDGGRVPTLSISSQTSGAIGGVKINPTTYTCNAALEVVTGGATNVLQLNKAAESGTVLTVNGTNGNTKILGNLQLGTSSNTVVTGNSGTLSVLTDNYFTLTNTFNSTALTSSASYYFSSNGIGLRTTVNQVPISIPYNCTLVGAAISAWNAGGATSQTASALYFRVNNTTDNLLSSNILWNTGSCNNCAINSNVTGLNISLNAGDYYESKLTLGELATPPNNGNITVTYYFARR